MGVPPPRPRIRDLGITLGQMNPAPRNAITDVGDVRVGHVTLFSGHGAWQEGIGPVRTGVTVVLPHPGNLFREKVVAAIHVINGFGKLTGSTQVDELGVIETPIALTNTLSVGAAFDGLVDHALRHNPEIGHTTSSINALVGECNDSYLNDMRGRHVGPEHVLQAIERAAGGPVAEGVVGAGTGMTCYGWKGGIGTASRRLPTGLGGFTVGALTLANFGAARDLTIAGAPVGAHLTPPTARHSPPPPRGSCIVVLATDAPANSRQLGRIARRAQNGLARTGTITGHGSGDYAIAFSTARTVSHWPSDLVLPARELAEDGPLLDGLFQATTEATEEAVVNALFTADTTDGVDGHVCFGLPIDDVLQMLRQ